MTCSTTCCLKNEWRWQACFKTEIQLSSRKSQHTDLPLAIWTSTRHSRTWNQTNMFNRLISWWVNLKYFLAREIKRFKTMIKSLNSKGLRINPWRHSHYRTHWRNPADYMNPYKVTSTNWPDHLMLREKVRFTFFNNLVDNMLGRSLMNPIATTAPVF